MAKKSGPAAPQTGLRWVLTSALVLLAALHLHAQNDDFPQSRQAVQEKLDSLQAEQGFPGATLAVVLPEGQTLTWATGFADLEKKSRMRPQDRMFSGSIGKTFVAAVVLRLVEQGRIKLDDRLAASFPQEPWVSRLPNGGQITLRMLLNHSSGIPEYLESPLLQDKLKTAPSRTWTPLERLEAVLGSEPRSPAGKGFDYADTNYIVVGMLLEQAAKKTYYQELSPLLASLQLDATRPSDQQVLPGLVAGYSFNLSRLGLFDLAQTVVVVRERRLAKMLTDGRYLFNPQVEWTGGGLLTSSADLAHWAKALYEGKVLKPESLKEMLKGSEGASSRYGLGVQIRPSKWGQTYGHSGWMPGYQSNMEYFPDLGISIAAQVNTDDSSLVNLRRIVLDTATIVAGSDNGAR